MFVKIPPLSKGLLPEAEVVATLEQVEQPLTLVLTGRDAPPALKEIADTVSIIQPYKHAMAQGVAPRQGVEF